MEKKSELNSTESLTENSAENSNQNSTENSARQKNFESSSQKNPPKVSVIIPVYNAEKYLAQCLKSVCLQTLREIEIICVNDGSTDDSAAILQDFAKRDERILVLQQENRGGGAARNAGLAVAKGEYLSFLDGDDFFAEDLLESAYDKCIKTQADICVYKIRKYNNTTDTSVSHPASFWEANIPKKEIFTAEDFKDTVFATFATWAWNKMFCHKFIKNAGIKFQEIMRTNDLLFSYSALVKAKRIVVLRKELLFYRIELTENCQATNDFAPLDFHKALLALKCELEKDGVYEKFSKAYQNLYVDSCNYNFGSLKTEDAKKELYNFLHKNAFPSMKINEWDRNSLYKGNLAKYDECLKILNNSYEEYMLDLKHSPTKSPSLKLLLSYHKPDTLFKDSVLTPVHAGRALAKKKFSPDDERLEWLLQNTLGDDTGPNISEMNGTFNEMTTVYWAWKNYEKIQSPAYIGFMHYRRHFVFDEKMQKPQYEMDEIGSDYFSKIKYDENSVSSIVEGCDFVATKPHWRKSLYEHFRLNHDISHLEAALQIIKKRHPKYARAAKKYLQGHDAYFCNMFIFSKKIFFDYCEWFFDIAFELTKQIDFSEKRFFVSEWLTGIFITRLLEQGKKGKFLSMAISEGEHEIPVAMATDNNYALQTLVAAFSVLSAAKPATSYDFYFLVSEDFSEENKALFEKAFKNKKCKIHFLKMGQAYKDASISISHITRATYYRLKLSSLLQNVGKCVYLDSDVIVKSDLSELFRTCVSDKYIAGVRALGYFSFEQKIQDNKKRLGIPSMEDYVNAGVLLVNLEKMRRDNLEKKFDELLKKNFRDQDQDILNVACFGQIRRLQMKFNSMTKYPLLDDGAWKREKYLQKYIDKNEWDNGRLHPAIIHYADKKKPWNDLSAPYANEWWDVVKNLESEIAKDIYAQFAPGIIWQRISSSPVIKSQEFSSTARCDIKLENPALSQSLCKIEIASPQKGCVLTTPKWFQNGGNGFVAECSERQMKLKVKCQNEGILKIALRAKDVRKDGKRLPLFIDYESLFVNKKAIFFGYKACSHDMPFKYELPARKGDEFTIKLSWKKHREDS